MLRPPTTLVRNLTVALTVALVAAMVATLLGLSTSPASAGRAVEAVEADLETELTLRIGRCEGCQVTMFSSDGTNPIYSSAQATVTDGSVTITVPSSRTAGLSVQVRPVWASSNITTNVVWRYSSTDIGDLVSFREARRKRRASGCWAGTINEAVELTVKVRRVRHLGRPSIIAWAPVTQSYLQPMKRSRRGVLATDDVLACNLYG